MEEHVCTIKDCAGWNLFSRNLFIHKGKGILPSIPYHMQQSLMGYSEVKSCDLVLDLFMTVSYTASS